MHLIVDALFPSHPPREEVVEDDAGDIPQFSLEELEVAVSSLRNKKAPGPDEIPGEALKCAHRTCPDLLLRMFQACLGARIFPSRWKTARLVLISKGKGEANSPSAFRPLCMLDTAGKVLEKLLQPRLLSAIQDAGDLSNQQYGFRRGRSTIDAIQQVVEAVARAEEGNRHSHRIVLLVTLDVKNAFNSARWVDILKALKTTFRIPGYLLQMVSDYLSERSLVYDTMEGQYKRAVTAGAAQGSILGPDLWNIMYDGLLRLEMPEETRLVGYADDVAVLVPARSVELAQLKLNQVMRRVSRWMREHGLSLALAKTEVVILTKKRIETIVPMLVDGERVETKPEAKYLGVVIDSKLSFGEQIRRAADKAAKATANLAWLMANTHGPKSSKRRLLMTAVESVLLYGAEVWGGAMRKKIHRKRLASVQRRAALRVISAYRTVSEPAALVIAGVIPIWLLAIERRAVYHRKAEEGRETASREERYITLRKWQEMWESETRGRWTTRLVPQITPWISRKHGEVTYYLTQFMSGHGCFRSYLHKMGKVDSPCCLCCGSEVEDAAHTIFYCSRWVQWRGQVEESVGLLSPDNIIVTMLRGAAEWDLISRYVEQVIRTKHLEDEAAS